MLLQRTLAYPLSSSELWDHLQGATITDWQRRGKYLLAQLSHNSDRSAGWLGVHLRMTGQLLWVRQDEPLPKHARLRIFFGNNRELRFVDLRTFGKFWWVPPTTPLETIVTGLKKLGPEPFSPDFSLDYLISKFKTRYCSIKTLLLDQKLVAGIGNIYADEALFKSGIKPTIPANLLNRKQIEGLRLAIVEVLQTAIEKGGTTFSDFRQVTGINGNYGGIAWVYRREGEPCRLCGTPIKRVKLGGRSTHFCPKCQFI